MSLPGEMLREFHALTDDPDAYGVHTIPSVRSIQLRLRLHNEERREVDDEMVQVLLRARAGRAPLNLAALAKELVDEVYVLVGTAVKLGIDFDGAFAEVHRSNMSKAVDGVFQKDAGGKVMKGPNYTPPDMQSFINVVEGTRHDGLN